MDLSRISLITSTSVADLKDETKLEALIPSLGFNDEILHEQPQIVKDNAGGLKIWQYPNQFAKYLVYLQSLNPQSYCEIGTHRGGSFVTTVEYLRKTGTFVKGLAVDCGDTSVDAYCSTTTDCTFMNVDSTSDTFKNYMSTNTFDCVFIDGNHFNPTLTSDYEVTKGSAKIIVFHDITNAACPDVAALWSTIKTQEAANYTFMEFIDQYPEVVTATGNNYLGIGVMVKK
jgi:hypothetical protein